MVGTFNLDSLGSWVMSIDFRAFHGFSAGSGPIARTKVQLPNGLGKEQRVAVFCAPEQEKEVTGWPASERIWLDVVVVVVVVVVVEQPTQGGFNREKLGKMEDLWP